MRVADRIRGDTPFQSTIARYAFSVAAVIVALSVRTVLMPLTGRGAPFALFFGAMLVTSLLAGIGPALLCLAISLPLGAALFAIGAGYSVSEAIFQSLLFGTDGLIIVYMTVLMTSRRRNLLDANRHLQSANEERARSLARLRETIELAPDPYFVADVDARLIDVNQAACRYLGYERDELVGKTIFDIIAPEDAARLKESGPSCWCRGR